MNPESIDHERLSELLAAASSGPWGAGAPGEIDQTEMPYGTVVELDSPNVPYGNGCLCRVKMSEEDQRLIVALRNAAPTLIQRSRLLDKVKTAINNPPFDDRSESLRAPPPRTPGGNAVNYWRKCIAEAADECGLSMTEDQLSALAESVEGAFENYGMYHGHDMIGNPADTQAQQELKRLRQEIKDREEWRNSTVPCPSCRDGIVHDIYGREQQCQRCDGRERAPSPHPQHDPCPLAGGSPMNATDFLALCESDPAEANRMVAEAAGCKVQMGWDNAHPNVAYCGCEDRLHKAPCGGEDEYCDGDPNCTCWPVMNGFVCSLDAAWTLEDWAQPHADGIFLLAQRHEVDASKPSNAAALFCADWLQARGKLHP